MLMTAQKASELFKEISKEHEYVLVFFAAVDENMANAVEELDGGDAACVEFALSAYISMCEATKEANND